LSELSFSEFIELVVGQDARPERPDDEDAPHLSDAVWDLAIACWVKEPRDRPTALALCTTVSHLLETTPVTWPTPDASPSLTLETLSIALPTPNTFYVCFFISLFNLII
jgi:hypothetical protein